MDSEPDEDIEEHKRRRAVRDYDQREFIAQLLLWGFVLAVAVGYVEDALTFFARFFHVIQPVAAFILFLYAAYRLVRWVGRKFRK